MRRAALAMFLAACGGDSASQPDGGPSCDVVIGVSPVAPTAPGTVTAEAVITGDVVGIVSVTCSYGASGRSLHCSRCQRTVARRPQLGHARDLQV